MASLFGGSKSSRSFSKCIFLLPTVWLKELQSWCSLSHSWFSRFKLCNALSRAEIPYVYSVKVSPLRLSMYLLSPSVSTHLSVLGPSWNSDDHQVTTQGVCRSLKSIEYIFQLTCLKCVYFHSLVSEILKPCQCVVPGLHPTQFSFT